MSPFTIQIILLVNVVTGAKINVADNKNIYMQLVHLTAKHANMTGCYVCGLIPHSAAHGFPMMTVPITSKYDIEESKTETSETFIRPEERIDDRPVNVVLSLGPNPWCIRQNGTAQVGETVDYKKIIVHPNFPEVRHTTVGVYWICGTNAYTQLPQGWSGTCALGHLVPAMRIVSNLPDRIRYQRSTDLFGTHHQSTWKRALGALIPTYGVMLALDQIADLSKEVELLANNTALGLSKISEELTAVRIIALQNRATLDYILSAQGGTCKIIGIECCSYIPDNNEDLKSVISNIHNVSRVLHEISTGRPGFLDWLTRYVGELGKTVVEYALLALMGLSLLAVFVKILKLTLTKLCCRETAQATAIHYPRTQVAYIILCSTKVLNNCNFLLLHMYKIDHFEF